MADQIAAFVHNYKFQVTIGQLMQIAPYLAKSIRTKLLGFTMPEGLPPMPVNAIVQSMEQDIVPTLEVDIQGLNIKGIQIDGGAGVIIISEKTYGKLKNITLHRSNLVIRMANYTRDSPAEEIRKIPVYIKGLKFLLNFVVMRLSMGSDVYPVVLGRPWLRAAKAVHDWATGIVTIPAEGKKIQLQTHQGRLDSAVRPVGVEMVQELLFQIVTEESEEDLYLTILATFVSFSSII